MAVSIDEMSVEVAPIAATSSAHGAASEAGATSAQEHDSAALHKMLMVIRERKARLKVS